MLILHPSIIYGVVVALVVLAASATENAILHKLSLVLLTAWALSNVAVAAVGMNAFPLAFPTIELVLAVIVAVEGHKAKSRTALAVFGLYGLMLVTHVVAYTAGATTTYGYHATINVIYAGQLMVVGLPSAWMAVRRWLPDSPSRPRHLGAHS